MCGDLWNSRDDFLRVHIYSSPGHQFTEHAEQKETACGYTPPQLFTHQPSPTLFRLFSRCAA